MIWTLLLVSSLALAKTPVRFNDFDPLNFEDIDSREWEPPSYAGQDGRTGYYEGVFGVPVGMEARVNFWIDIYSKYNTHQGVLHDSEHAEIVHEVLDFTDIESNVELTPRQKEKQRRRRMEDAKKRVKNRLLSLQGVTKEEGLSGERLKAFRAYREVEEKNKFKKASRKNRLRFQLGQKDRFQQAIYYSGRYIERIEKIFAEFNLPRELTRLVYVESSFNIYAVSKVGASGLFQIMPRTGRQFLKVGKSVDYRNHPYEAARAAAKLLRQYYRMLESWPLAVTGYNHGAYGVKKVTRRHKTRNIAELVKLKRAGRRFGFASRNFYATFLAALHVEKRAKETFKVVKWSPRLAQEDFRNVGMMSWQNLVKVFDGDAELARMHNPHLTSRVRKGYRLIPRKTLLHIPPGKAELATKLSQRQLRVAGGKFKKYKVRRGDTLSGIAEKFGTTIRRIEQINEIPSRHKIIKGQWLRVPTQ